MRDGVSNDQVNPIVDACREAVVSNHGVALHAIVLLTQRSIPKTTSGKVARAWCKRAYVEGTLSIVKAWHSTSNGNEDVEIAKECKDENDFEEEGKTPTNNNNDTNEQKAEQQNRDAVDSEGNNIEMSRLVAPFTEVDIRNMSVNELENMLEKKLVQVASTGSSGAETLKSPIDRNSSLISLGLDSMTLVQYKGILENRYGFVSLLS